MGVRTATYEFGGTYLVLWPCLQVCGSLATQGVQGKLTGCGEPCIPQQGVQVRTAEVAPGSPCQVWSVGEDSG